MTTLVYVLAPIAAVANGLASGIMLSTVIGIVPMFLSLPYGDYVRKVHFLWPRYDPIMPLTNGATLLLDIVLATVGGPAVQARPYFILAAVLLACVMTISIAKNVPINRYVFALDPDRQPDDWTLRDPRHRWRAWNLVRSALALLAFAVNVTAVLQLT